MYSLPPKEKLLFVFSGSHAAAQLSCWHPDYRRLERYSDWFGNRHPNNQSLCTVRRWYDKQVLQHGSDGAVARRRHKIAVAIYHTLNHDAVLIEHKLDHCLAPLALKKSAPLGTCRLSYPYTLAI
jgi:hypothetical protein